MLKCKTLESKNKDIRSIFANSISGEARHHAAFAFTIEGSGRVV